MLAAEDPSSERHLLASTPRRRGMDCKAKPSAAAKKLVQARLPFKRLNPEPKENGEPKKLRGPPVPAALDAGASDGENELEPPPLPPPIRATLVNGRGPLDGFMSRSVRHAPSITIDLTEDSNSASTAQQPAAPPTASSCPPAQDSQTDKGLAAPPESSATVSMETDAQVGADASPSRSEQPPRGVETEGAEQNETDISTHENVSLLSPSSSSSLSAAESSPEQTKTTLTPTTGGPKTNTDTDGKKRKRRSLKSAEEEQRRQEERQERERQRQEARAAKERKKEETRRLREERERERREKKEKEEREKREKKERDEKERAEKLRIKEEQRKVKQDAKLEEKKKKEEEKRVKEEKDRIKAEKAEITRFLQKPKAQQAPKTLAAACGKFAPFEIKENMCLAPLSRVQCKDLVLEELDQYLAQQDSTLEGLQEWTRRKPRSWGPTRAWRADCVGDCLVMVEGLKPEGVPGRQRYGRMKLLQFRENYRPAYWGTWNKRSAHISPRCPLRQDKELLDYEVDSDEEWEEEEPGESLSHSEGDDDDEGGEDDDDDDGFFVPHGYLSDGEGALEEEESGDVEKQKVRQRLKAREWDELLAKRKLKVLEAVVRGCVWEGEGEAGPETDSLQPYTVCMLEPTPAEEPVSPETSAAARERRDEQLLSQLLPLLHGNVNSSKVIITEFQEFCRQVLASPSSSSPQGSVDSVPTRIRLKRLIKEHAVYEKRPAYRRSCWYVHAEVLARFHQEALPVPCQWKYLTPGAHSARDETPGGPSAQGGSPPAPQPSTPTATSSSTKRKSTGSMSITKFMKKQGEAMETDGFQADTEDEEDETDCIIISTQPGPKGQDCNPSSDDTTPRENTECMEVTTSDPAAAHMQCATTAAV
ncbi:chromatin assembly factor 1 subunit A [Megalops cyprinoides]|uniref:chromatin assembly factor 1 subunit A n=1 Tax=Megalops cyprinoides TaxID=118141 RepID=UPI001864239F|nr:chromatin assembly factor 1 subunit A [Megalops cyprinoides]